MLQTYKTKTTRTMTYSHATLINTGVLCNLCYIQKKFSTKFKEYQNSHIYGLHISYFKKIRVLYMNQPRTDFTQKLHDFLNIIY